MKIWDIRIPNYISVSIAIPRPTVRIDFHPDDKRALSTSRLRVAFPKRGMVRPHVFEGFDTKSLAQII